MTNLRRRYGGSGKALVAAGAVGAVLFLANQMGLFPTNATYNYGYYGYYGGGGSEPVILTAPGPGGAPHVRVIPGGDFFAYLGTTRAGTFIARGELDPTTPDAAEIVTGTGAGLGPQVRVFATGGEELRRFDAYPTAMTAGVHVATGNLDTDPESEIITGPGRGAGPHVRAFNRDGTPVAGFGGPSGGGILAYTSTMNSGVRVAGGDLDGDGRAEILTAPGPGFSPSVRAFNADGTPYAAWGTDGTKLVYDANMGAGVFVATGHLDDNPGVEVVTTPDVGGGPHVQIFDNTGELAYTPFFAYPQAMRAGLTVATADLDADEEAEIVIGPGPGAGPHVRVFNRDGTFTGREHMVYDIRMLAGVNVGAGFL